jgi:hypothetical protein
MQKHAGGGVRREREREEVQVDEAGVQSFAFLNDIIFIKKFLKCKALLV